MILKFTLALAALADASTTTTTSAPSTRPATTAASVARAVNNVALPRFPSLSPDGSQLVFAWRGDLWRVPATGGPATRLTGDEQDDNYSVWSPDGSRIAFTTERVGGGNVFVMNADGSGVEPITRTDRYALVTGWHEDLGLIGHVRREQDWFPALRSYGFPLYGGEPTRLFDAFGGAPSASPDGSKVLFTRGGTGWSRRGYKGADNRELWLYDRDAKSYTRLTDWAGNDGKAKWLDDRQFVYLSDREDGTLNLYLQRLGEKEPIRLTPNDGVDIEDFDLSRDGKTLVYASWDRLYRVDMTNVGPSVGGRPIDLLVDEDAGARTVYRTVDRSVSEAALTPDGRTVAMVAFGQVYVRGTEAKSVARRVNPVMARCRSVAWSADGATLYYTSDETGVEAIHAAQATLSRYEVKKAADDAAKPATRPTRPAQARATTEPTTGPSTRPEPVVQPTTTSFSVSSEDGSTTRPTTEPATRPTIGPATTQATTQATTEPTTGPSTQPATTQSSDARKEEERNRWPDALRFAVEPFIASGKGDANASPSPDGKLIAFERSVGQLWVKDLAGGNERLLFEGWSPSLSWRWSPDSKHVAFVTEDRDNNSDVFIVPADGSRKPVNVTKHPDNDYSPRWSADGKMLALLSERNDNESDVYTVFLDRSLESLAGGDLDAYFKEAGDKAKRRERPKRGKAATTQPASQPSSQPTTGPTSQPTTDESDEEASTQPTTDATTQPSANGLDLDDAYLRLRRVTSLPGSESDLEISPAGDKLLFSAQVGASRAMMVVDRDAPEPRRLAGSANVQALTFEGDKAVVVEAGRAATLALSNGQFEYLDIADRLPVDVARFNEQKFREMARVLGLTYYDANLNGLDWPALTERYVALAKRVTTSDEFDHVANKFVGELNGSHLGVISPPVPNANAVTYGRLGIVAERDGDDAYKVTKVYDNGPSAKGPMRLKVGDRIARVEGEPIDADDTLESMFPLRSGKETLVTVRREGKDVDLLLTPIPFEQEAALAYDVWRRETAARVAELSGGRLGYIHVRGMDGGSLDVFERDLFAAAEGKDGLLIDVRNNGGGSTADLLLGAIMYPKHAYTKPRGYPGKESDGYPQDRLYIQRYNLPINLLCNEKSFSNAEIFSHAFKTLKRGTLVGVQTAGGVISTGGTSLLDGTTVRLPGRGWYTLDGTNMELNGALPDLVVWQTPEAEARGDDQQLKAAVDDLVKRMPKNPEPK